MLSKNILFIGKKFLSAPSGGREMLSALNFKLIKNIFKKDFFHYEILMVRSCQFLFSKDTKYSYLFYLIEFYNYNEEQL